jgi:hypothetical protein
MAKLKLNAYDQAVEMLQQIEDRDYRATLVEALIAARVKRELGYEHPSGDLAMQTGCSAAPGCGWPDGQGMDFRQCPNTWSCRHHGPAGIIRQSYARGYRGCGRQAQT